MPELDGAAQSLHRSPHPSIHRCFCCRTARFSTPGRGGGVNAWYFARGPKTWGQSVATTRDRHYGSAVLLPLLPPSYTAKVMNFGGGNPATDTTEIIDLSAVSPSWTPGPNMSTGRIQMNAVIL